MRLAEPVVGAAFGLRSPHEGDAAFTVSLRADAEVSRFLHRIPIEVDMQKLWEATALARDDDLPLIVFRATTRAAVGTAGIYNIDSTGRSAEWGRWALSRNSLAAAESLLLVLRIAFTHLSLETLRSRTLTRNTRVISLHDGLGFARTGEGHIDVDGTDEAYVEHAVRAADMPALERRLEPLAARIATHVT